MNNQNGFTLVELIAVLIILGIVATAGTLGFVNAIRGFVFAEQNIDVAQKAQATLDRITVELTHIAYNPPSYHVDHDTTMDVGYEVSSSSATSITFNANYGLNRGTATNVQILRNGNNITINGVTLCDEVTGFTLQYIDADGNPQSSFSRLGTRKVDVTLVIEDSVNETPVTFTTSIVPKFYL